MGFGLRENGDSISSSTRCRSHASTKDRGHGIDLTSWLKGGSDDCSLSDVSYQRFRRSRSARDVKADRERDSGLDNVGKGIGSGNC